MLFRSKFVRTNSSGVPLTTLKSNQFVVPDLGSKYPKPATSSPGLYDNVVLRNSQNTADVYRSGVGITASSTVGTSVTVDYSGKFVIPSQTIPLRGNPGWTVASATDSETVTSSQIAPHMHFSFTNRCRIKPNNINVDGTEPQFSRASYLTGSVIKLSDWGNGASLAGTPFKNQQACYAIAASFNYAGDFSPTLGSHNTSCTISGFPLPIPPFYVDYYNCYSNTNLNGDGSQFIPYCLTPNSLTYDISQGINGVPGIVENSFLCSLGLATTFGPQTMGTVNRTTAATYTSASAPQDWLGRSLVDVLPADPNAGSTSVYPGVNNIVTTTSDLYTTTTVDLTNHAHTITKNISSHNYAIQTNGFLVSPSGINTTVQITPDTAVSLNSVSSPFIVVEYLIKI